MRALAYLAVVLVLGVVSVIRWFMSRKAMRRVLAEDETPACCRLTSSMGEALFQTLGLLLMELADALRVASATGDLHVDLDEHYGRQARRQELAADARHNLEQLSDADRAVLRRLQIGREPLRGLLAQAEAEDPKLLFQAHQGLTNVRHELTDVQVDPVAGPYR